MSVTAKQLAKAGARGKDLDAVIREQLQMIDDKLLRADRTWGRNVVAHDLPLVMGFPGLEKRDAQRIIYSAIVRSLNARGFDTRLLLETERTTVYIAWMTDLAASEIAAMNALIVAHRIAREDLDDFYEQKAPATTAVVPPMAVRAPGRELLPRGGVALPGGGLETAAAPEVKTPAEVALLGGRQ